MDLDNYGLDFVIWIFCPPLVSCNWRSLLILLTDRNTKKYEMPTL